MAIQPLVLLPDPLLRSVSSPIEFFDDSIKKLSIDMLDTMYDAPRIGLAAIQIGIPKHMIVIDLQQDENSVKDPHILLNPVILSKSEETSLYKEGCLSIPEYYAEVETPATVRFS